MTLWFCNSKVFDRSRFLELNETWLKSESKTRRFYLTGVMTNFYSFIQGSWDDHVVRYFSLMHHCGINANLLLLTFSRAKF